MSDFVPGRVYDRQTEIHDRYSGQRYGGISTPAAHPMIFLFTDQAGEQYGYEDRFQADGTFWYFGEGQEGDMSMTGGNLAIQQHLETGKTLHLFEKLQSRQYRYVGEATYLGHLTQRVTDRNEEMRNALVFQLDITVPDLPSASVEEFQTQHRRYPYRSMPIQQLRELATAQPNRTVAETVRREVVRVRSRAVREYVLRRARGGSARAAEQRLRSRQGPAAPTSSPTTSAASQTVVQTILGGWRGSAPTAIGRSTMGRRAKVSISGWQN